VVIVEMRLRQLRDGSCSVLGLARSGRLETSDLLAVSFCLELGKIAIRRSDSALVAYLWGSNVEV
jgi:hypothetical protein